MNHNLNYRPEIDGLRALAVISVIIHHLSPSLLPGGFIGVDIFFVISGFLITKIISAEMMNNTFSFKEFYKRRIKRIYPVFIFVMMMASIFSALFFIRSEGELQRKGIEAGILSFANLFLSHRQGYWDFAANENPILHIWSLSVEEQYYLFFPIFLYLVFRKIKHKRAFLNVSIGLFIIFSLTYFIPEWVYKTIGINNLYYVSNIRFPELLVGSICAFLPMPKNRRILKITSFVLLLACFWIYHKDLPLLLNGLLLLPCILTATLILQMKHESLIGRFLSLKPIVFIGKISYSLYLFHWLFIAWANYLMGTTGEKVFSHVAVGIILSLTIIFSVLSYYFLENPIRKSKLSFKQSIIFIYLIPSLIIVSFNQITRETIKERNNIYRNMPTFNVDNNHLPHIALFGDSHAFHLETFVDYIGNKEGWKAVYRETEQHCHLPISETGTVLPGCEGVVKELEKASILFVSMFYDLKRNNGDLPRVTPQDFFEERFDQKFRALISYFAKTKPVYVFADVKVASRSPLRESILKQYGLEGFLHPITELGNKVESNQYIYSLIKEIPNVKWVDPTKYLPKTYFINGLPLFTDQDHLSKFGSFYMAEQFYKKEHLLQENEVKSLYK